MIEAIVFVMLILGFVAFCVTYWPIAIAVLFFIIIIAIITQKKKNDINEEFRCYMFGNRVVDIDNLDGHEFELLVADLLRKNGYTNIKVTPQSGDFGVDILANNNSKVYAIQCKRYSDKVGNHAVQEAYSGKAYYNADIAVVVTNNFFSKAAKETANKLEVELWDRNVLKLMVHTATEKKKGKDQTTNNTRENKSERATEKEKQNREFRNVPKENYFVKKRRERLVKENMWRPVGEVRVAKFAKLKNNEIWISEAISRRGAIAFWLFLFISAITIIILGAMVTIVVPPLGILVILMGVLLAIWAHDLRKALKVQAQTASEIPPYNSNTIYL